MKRTVTLRVNVPDDRAYADYLARVTQDPEVVTWGATGIFGKGRRVAHHLSVLHGIVVRRTTNPARYVKEHS